MARRGKRRRLCPHRRSKSAPAVQLSVTNNGLTLQREKAMETVKSVVGISKICLIIHTFTYI